MSTEVVQSYASAFCEMAKEQNKVARFVEEVAMLVPIFKEKDVIAFFKSPVFTAQDKEAAITAALGTSTMDQTMSDFIKLLAKNGRLHLFPEIIEQFKDSCTGERGIRGEITTSEEMSATEKSNVQKAIEKKLGKTLLADFKVDKSLSAGVEAKVGSYVIEDSLKSKLQKMGESLKRSSN